MNIINVIRRINLQIAGWILIWVSVLTIITHTMVISRIIPYQWINGGLIQTFEETYNISVSAIIIFVINMIIVSIASRIIHVRLNRFWIFLLKVYLWIQTISMGVSIIMQLLGTPFEKICMSVLVLIGFIATLRLAIERR